MNGPEHYRAAEQLLANIQSALASDGSDADLGIPEWSAIAQVHATLALAAATALSDAPQGGMGGNDWTAWHDTVSIDATTVTEATI